MFLEFKEQSWQAMIGISRVNDVKRYGEVIVQGSNVVSFKEKRVTGGKTRFRGKIRVQNPCACAAGFFQKTYEVNRHTLSHIL